MAVHKALIKLDDTLTTHSNGGVVEKVFFMADESETPPWTEWVDNSNYSIEDCPSDCKVGWIKKDKTGLIIDSNKRN